MRISNEQVIAAWNDESAETYRNYAAIGRLLGTTRQNARYRVLKLQAEGRITLPGRAAGYTLTSERARYIAKLRQHRKEK